MYIYIFKYISYYIYTCVSNIKDIWSTETLLNIQGLLHTNVTTKTTYRQGSQPSVSLKWKKKDHDFSTATYQEKSTKSAFIVWSISNSTLLHHETRQLLSNSFCLPIIRSNIFRENPGLETRYPMPTYHIKWVDT